MSTNKRRSRAKVSRNSVDTQDATATLKSMTQKVQVRLASGDSRRTCWVDLSKSFRVGDKITLKKSEDEGRQWTVLSVGAPQDSAAIRTDWRVGGL